MMMLHSTPLMIVVALIPLTVHGDPWSNLHSPSKFNKVEPTAGVPSHVVSQIMNDVPLKSISHLSHAGAHSSGWVEMDAKIDMRAIIELLDDIPEILHILRNISGGAEKADADSFFGSVISHITGLKDAMGAGFYDVNKMIQDLSHELNAGPLDATQKSLVQLLNFLESNALNPTHCELTEVDHRLQSMGRNIEGLLKQLLHDVRAEKNKGEQGLAGIRGNSELLLKIISLLNNANNSKSRGFDGAVECQVCQALHEMYRLITDQTNLLHGLTGFTQGITKDVAAVLKADGGLGGLRRDIQTLLRVDEGIRGAFVHLTKSIEALNAKTEKFFSQNHKIIIETQYAVAETAKSIQKTATNAEQAVKKIVQEASKAGRALNSKICP